MSERKRWVRQSRRVLLLVLLLALADSSGAGPVNWQSDGIPVDSRATRQHGAAIVEFGNGFVTVWVDQRNGTNDIYAQRMDAYGQPLWGAGGIPVCTAAGSQGDPVLTTDGSSRIFIVWEDWRTGVDIDVYAIELDANGSIAPGWAVDGTVVSNASGDQWMVTAVACNTTDVWIAWSDLRGGPGDVYQQWMSSGVAQLPANGDQVTFGGINWNPALACPFGGNVIYITWAAVTGAGTTGFDILAMLYVGGVQTWAGPVPVCLAIGDQLFPQIAYNLNGVYIAWVDERGGVNQADIYAQFVTGLGLFNWANNGIPVCAAVGMQGGSSTLPPWPCWPGLRVIESQQNLVLVWEDWRNGVDADLYGECIDPNGNSIWQNNGRSVAAGTGNQYLPSLAIDSIGEVFVTWEDEAGNPADPSVLAQLIGTSGADLWTPGGITVCSAAGEQNVPRAARLYSNGFFVAWQDERASAGTPNIYVQRIYSNGLTGDSEWIDVTSSPVDDNGDSRGAALADFNGDGELDLYLANFLTANRMLYHSNGDTFVDTTSGTGLGFTDASTAIAVADYDNDLDLDFYLVNSGTGNYLIRNEGNSYFINMTSAAMSDAGSGQAAVWGDYDNDGDKDLLLVNHAVDLTHNKPGHKLFRNVGSPGYGFTDVTATALPDTSSYGQAAAWLDYDGDGYLDIYLVNNRSQLAMTLCPHEPNQLFRNSGPPNFTFVEVTSGAGSFADTGSGQGVLTFDYDNDGDQDIYVTNSYCETDKLLRNDGGTFTDVTTAAGLSTVGGGLNTGVATADYDSDGDLDLYLVCGYNYSGQPNNFFMNNQGPPLYNFVDQTTGPLGEPGQGTGAVFGDYDNDSDIDLYLSNSLTDNHLFRNVYGSGSKNGAKGGSLNLYLCGTTSNSGGIGARVECHTGSLTQMREVSGSSGNGGGGGPVHFGLGFYPLVDTVVIHWSSGVADTLYNVLPQTMRLVEGAPADVPAVVATRSSLRQNTPNPFNPRTIIEYELYEETLVSLRVFDVSGRFVRLLVGAEVLGRGVHAAEWNGRDSSGRSLPSGTYFYRLQAGDYIETKRMTLLK